MVARAIIRFQTRQRWQSLRALLKFRKCRSCRGERRAPPLRDEAQPSLRLISLLIVDRLRGRLMQRSLPNRLRDGTS